MKLRTTVLGTASLLALALQAGGAHAQSAPSSPATSTASATSALEEIIVTAQKRGQNINSVGMSITAATGQQLEQEGITNVADLTRIEPSLQFSESLHGTPIYTIRGVGYYEQSLAASPTVSIYQDEVPYPFPVMSKGVLLDPERVEILKGPQGTLYGQNATGGAINFIAAKPTSTFTAGFDDTYGRFNDNVLSGLRERPTDTDSQCSSIGQPRRGRSLAKKRNPRRHPWQQRHPNRAAHFGLGANRQFPGQSEPERLGGPL